MIHRHIIVEYEYHSCMIKYVLVLRESGLVFEVVLWGMAGYTAHLPPCSECSLSHNLTWQFFKPISYANLLLLLMFRTNLPCCAALLINSCWSKYKHIMDVYIFFKKGYMLYYEVILMVLQLIKKHCLVFNEIKVRSVIVL